MLSAYRPVIYVVYELNIFTTNRQIPKCFVRCHENVKFIYVIFTIQFIVKVVAVRNHFSLEISFNS